MDLKRLRHIVALADEANFARAAQRVNLSQPALSRSIQAAEAEWEVILFDRGTTEITPTPAGEFVLERARKLLFDNRCMERDIALFITRKIGDLALGMGPFPATSFLPVLIPEIRKNHPTVHLRVEVNNTGNLVERLRNEEVDFFVADTSDLPHSSDLAIVPLPRQFGGLYVRANHPLLQQSPLQLADISVFGLATVHLPESVRTKLATMMGLRKDARPPLALECDDVFTLKRTVLASDTVLAVVHAAVMEEIDDGRLVPIFIPGAPRLYSEMGIVSLNGRSHSPMAQFVIGRLIAISKEIAADIDSRFSVSKNPLKKTARKNARGKS